MKERVIGLLSPNHIQTPRSATPTIVAGTNGTFILFTAIPNAIAKNINSIDIVATDGTATNVFTMTFANAAITRTSVNHENTEISFFPVLPIFCSITYDIDFPSCLIDANNEP